MVNNLSGVARHCGDFEPAMSCYETADQPGRPCCSNNLQWVVVVNKISKAESQRSGLGINIVLQCDGDAVGAADVVEVVDAAEAGDVDVVKVSFLVVGTASNQSAALLTPANALFARAGSEIPAQNGCPKAQLLG